MRAAASSRYGDDSSRLSYTPRNSRKRFSESMTAPTPAKRYQVDDDTIVPRSWLSGVVTRISGILNRSTRPLQDQNTDTKAAVALHSTPRRESRHRDHESFLGITPLKNVQARSNDEQPSRILEAEDSSIFGPGPAAAPQNTLADAVALSFSSKLGPATAPPPQASLQNRRSSLFSRADSTFSNSTGVDLFGRMRTLKQRPSLATMVRPQVITPDWPEYMAHIKRRKAELLRAHREWMRSQGLLEKEETKPAAPKAPALVPLPQEDLDTLRGAQKMADSKIFGTVNRVEISAADLKTLRHGQWLNDNVIDAFLADVTTSSAPTTKAFAFTTHFYTRLTESGYKAVSKWAKRKNVDVWTLDYLFIPINLGGSHWTAAMVDHKKKQMVFYDSMQSLASHGDRALSVITDYMVQEADRLGRKDKGESIYSYTKVTRGECPQQNNGNDCGVFTCEVISRLSKGVPLTHNQADMNIIRDRIAWRLYELATGTASNGVSSRL